jgi:uncharacterized membrane protein
LGQALGDLSKEQEQAIARSTMYLVAALLSVLMIFIAGLFLSAELKEQALQKAETAQQIELQQEITHQAQRPWTLWRRHAD